VRKVCVLGVPDPYSGKVPVALVVPEDDSGETREEGRQGGEHNHHFNPKGEIRNDSAGLLHEKKN